MQGDNENSGRSVGRTALSAYVRRLAAPRVVFFSRYSLTQLLDDARHSRISHSMCECECGVCVCACARSSVVAWACALVILSGDGGGGGQTDCSPRLSFVYVLRCVVVDLAHVQLHNIDRINLIYIYLYSNLLQMDMEGHAELSVERRRALVERAKSERTTRINSSELQLDCCPVFGEVFRTLRCIS